MLAGRDRLCIRCWSTVVEVHLGSVNSVRSGLCEFLLCQIPLSASTSHANHPDEENKNNYKQNSTSDSTSDVGKFRLVFTMFPSERTSTLTIRFAFFRLQTLTVIATMIFTIIHTWIV